MKKFSSRSVFSAVLCFFLCAVSTVSGQQNWPPNPTANFENGIWAVPDANGAIIAEFQQERTRDLCSPQEISSWTDADGNQNPEWEFQNGNIRRLTGNKDLFLKGEFKDFIFEFEFKIEFAGNSGVFFHSWNEKEKAVGHEYQIIDDMNRRIHPTLQRYFTGSFYQLFYRYDAAGPINYQGFNKGKIMVMGNHVELWLNDKLAVNVEADSPLWKCLVANSHSNSDPRFGKLNGGRIAFQNHGHEVIFRNVRLATLKKIK